MVIKGKSVGHATNLARYLERDPRNRSVEVIEIRGAAADNLRDAFDEWSHTAAGTRCKCKLPLYSALINPLAHETLTHEQYVRAADILEHKLGLTGQPRAIIIQINDKGREHAHVVWSRIDIDRMRAIPDGHNYRLHEIAARAIEREFRLERVQGAHAERDGRERPQRAPNQAEMQKAEHGLAPRQVKQFITELWQRSDNGQAFKAALEQEGWVLARGDRRDFCIVDPYGHEHSLARRIDGAKASDVRHKLKDLDRNALPSVAEAKHQRRDRNPALKYSPDRMRQERDLQQAPKATRQIQRPLKIRTPALTPARATVKAAAKLLHGIASFFESLLGGGPSHPERKAQQEPRREREIIKQQPTRHEREMQIAIEQNQDDLTRRRQDFARKYGHHVPLEREADHKIEQRQRECDDRDRSR